MFFGMKDTCTEATGEDATGHTCMIWNRLEQNPIKKAQLAEGGLTGICVAPHSKQFWHC